ncbi:hypothetical protein MD588_11285 [Photobacterium sp. SDRW27]|uniref:hypothetical protein n=1 Tax=Photobacterium obscurum TaxID=2829490 RepID=UPI002244E044|nr:hypothetical protein [Photobacterium obscurum]MCW8329391.1 hypothetical protein [Photobacterium obscurum]
MKQQLKLFLAVIIIAMCFSSHILAKSSKADKCLKTREKIVKINNKMRHQYSNKQGAKYRKKLEKLYKDEFNYCF